MMQLTHTFELHGQLEVHAFKQACVAHRFSFSVEPLRADGVRQAQVICYGHQLDELKATWKRFMSESSSTSG